MNDRVIYAKTDAGRQEIRDRGQKLPASLRSLLLMIDGQRDQPQLRELMLGLHAPDDALERLLVMGLVKRGDGRMHAPETSPATFIGQAVTSAEPVDPRVVAAPDDRYARLYALLGETVARDLGLRGYFVQLKVERCADLDALLALLPEVAIALAKARDQTFARDWLGRARAVAQN